MRYAAQDFPTSTYHNDFLTSRELGTTCQEQFTILPKPITLKTCTTLECGRKRSTRRKPMRSQGKLTNSVQTPLVRIEPAPLARSVWSLHVFPATVLISSGCSGFLSRPKNVQVCRLIALYKLPPSVKGVDEKVG